MDLRVADRTPLKASSLGRSEHRYQSSGRRQGVPFVLSLSKDESRDRRPCLQKGCSVQSSGEPGWHHERKSPSSLAGEGFLFSQHHEVPHMATSYPTDGRAQGASPPRAETD